MLFFGPIVTIDLILLVFLSDWLFPHSTVIPTVFGGIDLNVFWLLPLSVVMDREAIASRKNMLRKFTGYGVASGLITPPLSLLDKWMPAVLSQVGVHGNSASKLALEVFSDDAIKCFQSIIPTAVFAAIMWQLIYMFNRLLVNLYHYGAIPAVVSFRRWLKEVYRF